MPGADFTVPVTCGVGIPTSTATAAPAKKLCPIFSLSARAREPRQWRLNPVTLGFSLSLHAAAFVTLAVLTTNRDTYEPPEFIPPFVVQGGFGVAAREAPAPIDDALLVSPQDIPRVDLAPAVLADIDLESTPREIDDAEIFPLPQPAEPEPAPDPAPALESWDRLRQLARKPSFPIPGAARGGSGADGTPADVAAAPSAPPPPPAPRPAPPAISGRVEGGAGRAAAEGSGSFEGAAALSGYQVKPPYPAAAQRLGLEGTCVIEMEIDAFGAVVRVTLVEGTGHPCLDEAALSAARRWRFRPARKNGIAASAIVLKRFQFKLNH